MIQNKNNVFIFSGVQIKFGLVRKNVKTCEKVEDRETRMNFSAEKLALLFA